MTDLQTNRINHNNIRVIIIMALYGDGVCNTSEDSSIFSLIQLC